MTGTRNLLRVVAVAAGLVLTVALARDASAITLGLPDINFDSSHGSGANTFTSQGVHYNATTGLLGVSAKALDITFDGVTSTPLIGGKVDYQVKLVSASSGGGFVTGNFGTDGISGSDLIVADSTGTLLMGNFLSYSIDAKIGKNLGSGDAVFLVTGGSLASYYTTGVGGMVHLEFNVSPLFAATSFTANFDGKANGDIAPVPEPATLLLLGSGLAGMGWFGRKRLNKDREG